MDAGPDEPDGRVTLPRDQAAAVARAGVDPTLPRKAIEMALRRAIADRRGYVDLDSDEIGWAALFPRRAVARSERDRASRCCDTAHPYLAVG